MSTPAEVVASAFAQAQSYASSAQASLVAFTDALNGSIYAPPTISVTWNSIAVPSLPSLPAVPTMPTITFTAPTAPADWVLAEPAITIDDFTEAAPTLNLPNAPTITYGAVPSIPAVADVAIPAAPTLPTVAVPTFLALSTPTFAGIDLHTAYLAKLDNIPTLALVAPTPYSYALGAKYASTLLTTLQSILLTRLAGGTGLSPAVEQAIWDRGRSRETQIALGNEAEIMRSSEALGFPLPAGVLAAQLREAQQTFYDKLSGLSRDVSIKQADLEQENLKQTIAAGMDLEGKLVDYSFKLEELTYQSAKTMAENAIASYNSQVEQFKALLQAYNTYAAAYKVIIDGELAKVEVYKAQLQGEQTKAQVNLALVQQYKAQIEAGLSLVEIFKAQVGAANTLIELEKTKISAAGEQIRGYVAQVNAETAKVEAYKAGVQGESTKVEVYRVKADAFRAKAGAQGDKARAQIARFSALAQAKTVEWQGYTAKVEAERSRITALGAQSTALLEGYKAGAAAIEAEAGMHTRIFEAQIKDYEAGQSIALQAGKINGDFTIATNNARLEASKVGAQVFAQLTASAYGMIHAQAGVSASGGTSVSYSYSNDTLDAAPTVTSV